LNPSLRTAPAARAAGSVLVALLIVGAVFALAAVGEALWPEEEAAVVQPAVVPGALQEARDRARLRCETCGVIAAIRHVEAGSGAPAGYEFSVRLADGSLRLTTSASLGEWRVGDRIRLMGGAPAP
jgi:hypothetical protein